MEIRICPECKKASYARNGTESIKCGHCDYINTGQNDHLDIRRTAAKQKRLKKEKNKAQELKTLKIRAGKIAHDFNNLLTGIIGNLSMLEETTSKDEESYERVTEAKKASILARDLTLKLFTLNQEVKAAEEAIVTEEEAVKGIPCPAQGRVLVMDDEETIRNVAYSMLTGLGYSAVTSSEGKEAIDFYKEAKEKGEPFDIVIMDLTVAGGMGGKEAVKKLLEFDPSAVAVVSSGYTNSPVMKDCKKYGFKGAIAKPYGVEELLIKVHGTIGGK